MTKSNGTAYNLLRKTGILAVILMAGWFYGCGSSDDTQKPPAAPTATDIMQKQMMDLRTQNDSLAAALQKSQQDYRAATAHSAELETELTELKEKPAPAPVQEAPPPKQQMTDAASTYREGLDLFQKHSYDAALEKFSEVADAGQMTMYTDHSTYWAGECHYAMKHYSDALGSFQKVLSFDHSSKKSAAQMMIGNCYLAMKSRTKAKDAYETLIKKFPASVYARRAKEKLKTM